MDSGTIWYRYMFKKNRKVYMRRCSVGDRTFFKDLRVWYRNPNWLKFFFDILFGKLSVVADTQLLLLLLYLYFE